MKISFVVLAILQICHAGKVKLKTPIKPWMVSISICNKNGCHQPINEPTKTRICNYPNDYYINFDAITERLEKDQKNAKNYLPCERTNETEIFVRSSTSTTLKLPVECTGVLVSLKHVMTSDYCVNQATSKMPINERFPIGVVAGLGDDTGEIRPSPQVRNARKVFGRQTLMQSPKEKSYIGRDIAFLEVNTPFHRTFGSVEPARLIEDKKATYRHNREGFIGFKAPHRRCWAFMFIQDLGGPHEFFGDPMTILDKKKCKSKYRGSGEIDPKWDQTICAEPFHKTDPVMAFGAKPGDFGAPLICYFMRRKPGAWDEYFVPMVSGIAMHQSTDESDPIIFTKVAYFADDLKKLSGGQTPRETLPKKNETDSNGVERNDFGFPMIIFIFCIIYP